MEETVNYKGFDIIITNDDSPENPRDWDNIGTMTCWHGRYILGDEQGDKKYGKPSDFLAFLADIDLDQLDWDKLVSRGIKHTTLNEYLMDKVVKSHVILPLYLYDHSGITMNTTGFSCRWDSGCVGYIWVSKEKLLEEFGGKILTKQLRERAERYLRNEVETYDQYLTGDVYGFEIKNASGEHIDSCWGFFGDDHEANGLWEHAKPSIDWYIAEKVKLHGQQVKSWIKSRVPLQYRKPLTIC